MQKWKYIDEKYLLKLREVEPRIPLTDYGSDKFKPFFGVLFTVGNLSYVTQVSSPKPRHYSMSNQKDFQKLYKDDNLLCVVNLNYMFPVPTNLLIDVKYKEIEKYRTFKNEKEKSKYITLLKDELSLINSMNISIKANNLYYHKINYPNDTISKRCLDFIELENVANSILKSGLI